MSIRHFITPTLRDLADSLATARSEMADDIDDLLAAAVSAEAVCAIRGTIDAHIAGTGADIAWDAYRESADYEIDSAVGVEQRYPATDDVAPAGCSGFADGEREIISRE